MRIVLIGQAAFGEKVLQALLNKGETVVGVFCPPDSASRPSPLRLLAERLAIPVYQPRRMRDPEVFEVFSGLRPDLGVMAYVTDIVPECLLSHPRCGTIQYHPSLLPRHRGGSAINWAVIGGEDKTGLTIFWPDQGIDTGPILLQKTVPIDPDDTAGSLYFNKLFPLGVQALLEAVDMVRAGTAPRLVQDEAQASYEPLCTPALTVIDWECPSRQVYNLIRGANPQPGATTAYQGQRLKVYDSCHEAVEHDGIPGEVLARTDNGLAVAAEGGVILVRRVQPDGEGKLQAAEFADRVHLQVGDRLGR
jgi:methionyl-tRNA formyltransferase